MTVATHSNDHMSFDHLAAAVAGFSCPTIGATFTLERGSDTTELVLVMDSKFGYDERYPHLEDLGEDPVAGLETWCRKMAVRTAILEVHDTFSVNGQQTANSLEDTTASGLCVIDAADAAAHDIATGR